MRITLIYDNEVYQEGLEADWGFSCLVEVENTPKILFDTGTRGSILLGNMEKLGIDPASIDEVIISHAHYDHRGGLSDFLKINSQVKVYIPASCPAPSTAKEVIRIGQSRQIHENVFSTGELRGIEQSLAVKTDRGIAVIAGCSHPGVRAILDAANQFGKVYALVGGLHGFHEFELLSHLQIVCACHCTQHIAEIRSLYPEKYISGGAGKVIVC
ncbi:MAG: MBL fold metallo-hydrolase [Candidatus Auribacterota bacterium]|nr:MBL fold metallo-hydrolase [Candidatus Auribacterota bacterium]